MNDRSPGLLRVHLLGTLTFDAVLSLQRDLAARLAYWRDGAALVLCEHPPLITVGRQGSPGDILAAPDDLATRGWPVRWVHRGGGTILHLPGQLAVYPIVPLDLLGLTVRDYLHRLQAVLAAVLNDFSVAGGIRSDPTGMWVNDRPIAALGIAVRRGVTSFGATLNVDPDLTLTRLVVPAGGSAPTSLARERRGPLRQALVRQQLVEHFRDCFGFADTDVLFSPPGEPGHQRLTPG